MWLTERICESPSAMAQMKHGPCCTRCSYASRSNGSRGSFIRQGSGPLGAALRRDLAHLQRQRANCFVVHQQVEVQCHRLLYRQAAELSADIDRRLVARPQSGWLAELERRRDQRIRRTNRDPIQVERTDSNGVWLTEHVPRDRKSHDQEQRPERARDLWQEQLLNASAVDVDLPIRRHRGVIAQCEN